MRYVRILHQRYNYLVHLAGIGDCWNVTAVGLFWFFLLFSEVSATLLGCGFRGLFEGDNFSSSLLLGSLEKTCGSHFSRFYRDIFKPLSPLWSWDDHVHCVPVEPGSLSRTVSVDVCDHQLCMFRCFSVSFHVLRQHHLNCQTSLCTNALACISQRLNLLSCCFTETLS